MQAYLQTISGQRTVPQIWISESKTFQGSSADVDRPRVHRRQQRPSGPQCFSAQAEDCEGLDLDYYNESVLPASLKTGTATTGQVRQVEVYPVIRN
jgi:hypothetical protein